MYGVLDVSESWVLVLEAIWFDMMLFDGGGSISILESPSDISEAEEDDDESGSEFDSFYFWLFGVAFGW